MARATPLSLHNYRSDFNIFGRVTDLYSLGDLEVPYRHGVTPQLFYFIKNHLLFSTATFFRCHMAEAANSVRVAIDSALIAYMILEGHGTEEEYVQGGKTFKQTTRYIANKRRDDPTLFPLAQPLLDLHSRISATASHADFDVFEHRMKVQQVGKGKAQIQLGLFHYPEDTHEFRMLFLEHLRTYLRMAQIFEDFLTNTLHAVSSDWGQQREVYT